MKRRTRFNASLAVKIYNARCFDKLPEGEICKKYGVCPSTVWRWSKLVESDQKLKDRAARIRNLGLHPSSEAKSVSVKEYLAIHPNATWESCCKDLDLLVSRSWFYKTARNLTKPELKPALTPEQVSAIASPDQDLSVLNSLKETNNFLRWWNIGERRGFVARLLKELKLLNLSIPSKCSCSS